MATGKSFWASGGKNTSTAFLVNGWLPAVGWPTSITCNCNIEVNYGQNNFYLIIMNILFFLKWWLINITHFMI
jgi:hypothetical protein